MINKHFGKIELKQFFNPSTVKLPYSCVPNMNSIISNPNRKLVNTQYDISNNSITNHLSQVQPYLLHPVNLHQQHQHKLYLNTLKNIMQHLKRNVTAEGKIFVPLNGKCWTKSEIKPDQDTVAYIGLASNTRDKRVIEIDYHLKYAIFSKACSIVYKYCTRPISKHL